MTEEQKNFLSEINQEYINGFLASKNIPNKPRVTIYGGARFSKNHKIYKEIVDLADIFRQKGYIIVTGGGPGVMQAAFDKDNDLEINSVAFKISNLRQEQPGKGHEVDETFNYFSVRKYFLRQSDVFVVTPGGFGTLDELMELVDMVKTGKADHTKIFLYDTNFWLPLLKWIEKTLLESYKTISKEDFDLLILVDNFKDIQKHL